MKYNESTDYSFLWGDNYFMYDHLEDETAVHIFLKAKPHSCRCPVCAAESRQLHATYTRVLQDTPIHCKKTFLHVKVYKYNCVNPHCSRKVFMEELPFAKASQVRTDALNALILGIAMFLSNEGASRILSLIGVKISNDTIQSLYDRIAFGDDLDVEGIGVDDVAIRKGQTYATAIYDIKDHQLITLLNGRDGEPLKEWLKDHGKVKLAARDRSSAYASAINEVMPECVQVADRFHLLQNLLTDLKDMVKEDIPDKLYLEDGQLLAKAPQKVPRDKKPTEAFLDSLCYDNTPPLNPDGTECLYDNKRHHLTSLQYMAQAEGREKKRQFIRQVQNYWEQLTDKKLKTVADEFGIAPATAKKYVNMSEADIKKLDAPNNYKKRESPMNAWLNVIYKMMADGHSNETIYYYIQRQAGFTESKAKLEKYIYLIGKNNFPNRTPFSAKYLREQVYLPSILIIRRREVLKYVLTCNPKTKKNEVVGQYISVIKEKYAIVAKVENIFKEFHGIIMGAEPEKLDEFIEKYEESEIRSFCQGMKKDIAPIKNAISLPVSSGFVEGNNNKFKLLKRIVYGRSGLVNLTKKCKLAFWSKCKGFSLKTLLN